MAGDALRTLHAAVGLVPNLAATMAESPALLNGFLALRDLYAQTGLPTRRRIQVLSLTAAFENDCAWCVAFHTAMALKRASIAKRSTRCDAATRRPIRAWPR